MIQSRLADKLNIIATICSQNIELLLDGLAISYKQSGSKYYGRCPIHEGADNIAAWNLYPNIDNTEIPIWKCRTHNCHKEFKQTIFGLVQGVLSKDRHVPLSFSDSIQWVCHFLGVDINAIKTTAGDISKKSFINNVNNLNKKVIIKQGGPSREEIRKRLIIPAEYYLKRGFSQHLLDKYDIGLCFDISKTLHNHIIVPVYDNDYKYMVGAAGRKRYEKCLKCKSYHSPTNACPAKPTWIEQSKWINSPGFDARNHFFNYWFAKESIKQTGIAVLVEGPPDVIKLVEHGIHNVIGIFGTDLTEEQKLILETSGAFSLVVLLDNDEPGFKAAKIIKEQLGRLYRLYFPKLSVKDPGEMNSDMITNDIKSLLDKLLIL